MTTKHQNPIFDDTQVATKMHSIYDFLKDAKGVIHVGASTGQERDIYANVNLPVIWIEANQDLMAELLQNLRYYGNQQAICALVAEEDGKPYTFHFTNNSYSSSIFKLLKHKEVWPDVKELTATTIQSRTLTSLVKQNEIALSQYDTLILDVQGAELLVLQGAKEILPHFKYIRVEASDSELYEGQCLDHQLSRWLLQHGFREQVRWKTAESTDVIGIFEILYQSEISLKNCQITDDVTGNQATIKVGICESNPRLGFQVHHSVMFQAFRQTTYPIARVAGAFWEQSIQKGFNNLVKLGCDYIITVDYDSIFTREDVETLLLMAVRYPQADALTSWQLKRHDGGPSALLGWKDKDGKYTENIPVESVLNEEVTEVDHCVFGLTLIKVDALKKMAKPWFQSFPNVDGEWEDGKVDADSYFWMKWKEAGNTIFAVNEVKIGHLDEVIMWVEPDFTASRQSLSLYHKIGRPF